MAVNNNNDKVIVTATTNVKYSVPLPKANGRPYVTKLLNVERNSVRVAYVLRASNNKKIIYTLIYEYV